MTKVCLLVRRLEIAMMANLNKIFAAVCYWLTAVVDGKGDLEESISQSHFIRY